MSDTVSIPREEDALDILAQRVSKYLLDGEVLDLEGAAQYLKMPVSTLYKKCNNREIPHSKPGKTLCFLRSELKAWIERHSVPTNEQIKSGTVPA